MFEYYSLFLYSIFFFFSISSGEICSKHYCHLLFGCRKAGCLGCLNKFKGTLIYPQCWFQISCFLVRFIIKKTILVHVKIRKHWGSLSVSLSLSLSLPWPFLRGGEGWELKVQLFLKTLLAKTVIIVLHEKVRCPYSGRFLNWVIQTVHIKFVPFVSAM